MTKVRKRQHVEDEIWRVQLIACRQTGESQFSMRLLTIRCGTKQTRFNITVTNLNLVVLSPLFDRIRHVLFCLGGF